jgi:hypothetical protein
MRSVGRFLWMRETVFFSGDKAPALSLSFRSSRFPKATGSWSLVTSQRQSTEDYNERPISKRQAMI